MYVMRHAAAVLSLSFIALLASGCGDSDAERGAGDGNDGGVDVGSDADTGVGPVEDADTGVGPVEDDDVDDDRCADGAFDLFGAPNPLFAGDNELEDVIDLGVGHRLQIAATHTQSNASGGRSRRWVTEVTFSDGTVASMEPIDDTDFVLVAGQPGTTEMTVWSCTKSRTLTVQVHEAASWQVEAQLTAVAARGPEAIDGQPEPETVPLDDVGAREIVVGDDVTLSIELQPLGPGGERLRGSVWESSPRLDAAYERSSDADPDHMVFTLDQLVRGDVVEVPLGPGPDAEAIVFEVVGIEDAVSLALQVGTTPAPAPAELSLGLIDDYEYSEWFEEMEEFADGIEPFWFTPPVRGVLTDASGRPILGFQDALSWSFSTIPEAEPLPAPPEGELVEMWQELVFGTPTTGLEVDGLVAARVVIEPDRAYEITWSWGEVQQRISFVTQAIETP